MTVAIDIVKLSTLHPLPAPATVGTQPPSGIVVGSTKTYRASGINLKATPLGESDRIVTILTKEHGLIRAVAKGSRKQTSKLGGCMELFVVNDLQLAQGRSLDRIAQAQLHQSFPQLRSSLAKLTTAQYWAEVALYQALSQLPQEELFVVLIEHLNRLERASTKAEILPLLTHGLYHLLAIAGVAPQVRPCADCPGLSDWSFSPDSGGIACNHCVETQRPRQRSIISPAVQTAFRTLPSPELPPLADTSPKTWLAVERQLRRTVQYQFDRTIRSASLVDSCFRPLTREAVASQPTG